MEICPVCNAKFVFRVRGMEGAMVECVHCLAPFWRLHGQILFIFPTDFIPEVRQFWQKTNQAVCPCIGRISITPMQRAEQTVFDKWVGERTKRPAEISS